MDIKDIKKLSPYKKPTIINVTEVRFVPNRPDLLLVNLCGVDVEIKVNGLVMTEARFLGVKVHSFKCLYNGNVSLVENINDYTPKTLSLRAVSATLKYLALNSKIPMDAIDEEKPHRITTPISVDVKKALKLWLNHHTNMKVGKTQQDFHVKESMMWESLSDCGFDMETTTGTYTLSVVAGEDTMPIVEYDFVENSNINF